MAVPNTTFPIQTLTTPHQSTTAKHNDPNPESLTWQQDSLLATAARFTVGY